MALLASSEGTWGCTRPRACRLESVGARLVLLEEVEFLERLGARADVRTGVAEERADLGVELLGVQVVRIEVQRLGDLHAGVLQAQLLEQTARAETPAVLEHQLPQMRQDDV